MKPLQKCYSLAKTMPSWDTLSNSNLADVMAYIRSLNDSQAQEAP